MVSHPSLIDENKNSIYVLISGIPIDFHTPDLRNFFSYSIENETYVIFNYRHRPHSSKQFNVCVIKLKANKFDEFLKLYDKKNWINSRGLIQKEKVTLKRIKILDKRHETQKNDDALSEESLKKLLEFRNIPHWMPQGNVGTPTKTFVAYINQCIMPTSLISKLGINLKFLKKFKKKKYANVEFNYEKAQKKDEYYNEDYFYDRETNAAKTASGHTITETIDDEKKINELNYLTKLQAKASDEVSNQSPNENGENLKEPDEDDDDDDEMEDWDRHCALHDDVTKQDRTSPYFFEEEIELKWEKGGSGLVFYTDNNFWKDHEDKDFDAETADDLDIDMSVYYEPNSGDKDSLDLLSINREQMLRDGASQSLFDDEVRDSKYKINSFRKTLKNSSNDSNKNNNNNNNKGFGHSILEKLGWKPGNPVGNPRRKGLVEALDGSDGKLPLDKTGIGYHGVKVDKEKLVEMHKQNRIKEHRNSPYYIASKYDNDPSKPDSLLKRFDPTMKYRSIIEKPKKST